MQPQRKTMTWSRWSSFSYMVRPTTRMWIVWYRHKPKLYALIGYMVMCGIVTSVTSIFVPHPVYAATDDLAKVSSVFDYYGLTDSLGTKVSWYTNLIPLHFSGYLAVIMYLPVMLVQGAWMVAMFMVSTAIIIWSYFLHTMVWYTPIAASVHNILVKIVDSPIFLLVLSVSSVACVCKAFFAFVRAHIIEAGRWFLILAISSFIPMFIKGIIDAGVGVESIPVLVFKMAQAATTHTDDPQEAATHFTQLLVDTLIRTPYFLINYGTTGAHKIYVNSWDVTDDKMVSCADIVSAHLSRGMDSVQKAVHPCLTNMENSHHDFITLTIGITLFLFVSYPFAKGVVFNVSQLIRRFYVTMFLTVSVGEAAYRMLGSNRFLYAFMQRVGQFFRVCVAIGILTVFPILFMSVDTIVCKEFLHQGVSDTITMVVFLVALIFLRPVLVMIDLLDSASGVIPMGTGMGLVRTTVRTVTTPIGKAARAGKKLASLTPPSFPRKSSSPSSGGEKHHSSSPALALAARVIPAIEERAVPPLAIAAAVHKHHQMVASRKAQTALAQKKQYALPAAPDNLQSTSGTPTPPVLPAGKGTSTPTSSSPYTLKSVIPSPHGSTPRASTFASTYSSASSRGNAMSTFQATRSPGFAMDRFENNFDNIIDVNYRVLDTPSSSYN